MPSSPLARERSSGVASTTRSEDTLPLRTTNRRRLAVPPPTEVPEELHDCSEAMDALLRWWTLHRECAMPAFRKPGLNDQADDDAATCPGLSRGRHRLLVMTVRLSAGGCSIHECACSLSAAHRLERAASEEASRHRNGDALATRAVGIYVATQACITVLEHASGPWGAKTSLPGLPPRHAFSRGAEGDVSRVSRARAGVLVGERHVHSRTDDRPSERRLVRPPRRAAPRCELEKGTLRSGAAPMQT